MSHNAQRAFCERARMIAPQLFNKKRVLDVGSLDVNGNNRWLFKRCYYFGIDVVAGKNVDRVCMIHALSEQFDFVISTECLEHDPDALGTLHAMCQKLEPGGALLMTCGGPGRAEHGTRKYPIEGMVCETDYYRNVSPAEVAAVLDCYEWRFMHLEFDGSRGDTRMFAVRA